MSEALTAGGGWRSRLEALREELIGQGPELAWVRQRITDILSGEDRTYVDTVTELRRARTQFQRLQETFREREATFAQRAAQRDCDPADAHDAAIAASAWHLAASEVGQCEVDRLTDWLVACVTCGTTKASCDAWRKTGQICCPDCRHGEPGPPAAPEGQTPRETKEKEHEENLARVDSVPGPSDGDLPRPPMR